MWPILNKNRGKIRALARPAALKFRAPITLKTETMSEAHLQTAVNCRERGGTVFPALLGACLALALCAVPATPRFARAGMIDVVAPSSPLRIANWNLAERPGTKPNDGDEAQRPSWRTSFGSERRTSTTLNAEPATIAADVVILQGLESVREIRRTFPARDWRLIVSRQILENDDPLNPWAEEAFSEIPTTAIAVRYQPNLRVTGQEHLLDIAARGAQSGSSTRGAPAATAARINWAGKIIWILSVDLTTPCITAGATCTALQRLETWRTDKKRDGAAVVTGGQFAGAPSGLLPSPPCEARSLLVTPADGSSRPTAFAIVPDTKTGCLLKLDFPY